MSQELNEIKKVLYKEKPVANQTLIREDGFIEYECDCSLGRQKFVISPEDNTLNDNGKYLAETKEIPAQLLIRWLI